MKYNEVLSNFYSNLSFEDFPDEVVKRARITLFDFFAVLITGREYGVLSPVAEAYVRNFVGIDDVYCYGLGFSTSEEIAALLMGIISHTVELDDGHRFGTSHPAVSVIPSVLASAYKHKSSYKDVLQAIIIGYDFMLRLARSINPSHLRRGFHSTATCGSIGASAAVASIRKFNNEQTMHTVSIGALHSSGLQEMLHSNPSIKALQPGKAAQAGVFSANFVSLGAKGPVSVFEGYHGWLKAMTDEFRQEDLIGELGSRWEIMYTYTKLYPTCRHCHQAIDLAIDLYNMGYSLPNISKLNIKLYNVAISEVGQINAPNDLEEAMFSVSYAVSIALVYGKVGINEIKKHIDDKEIINFSKSINIIEDSEMNKLYPNERGSKFEVQVESGETFTLENKLPKGEYDTRLTDIEYLEKAKNILFEVTPEKNIEELWELVVENSLDDVSLSKIKEIFERIG